jgi:hypothetical protein
MKNQNSLIIEKSTSKAREIHIRLCAAMADLDATGVITKGSDAGRHLQDARSGMDILLKILTSEVKPDSTFGLQKPFGVNTKI